MIETGLYTQWRLAGQCSAWVSSPCVAGGRSGLHLNRRVLCMCNAVVSTREMTARSAQQHISGQNVKFGSASDMYELEQRAHSHPLLDI